ncbi:unnamed protein product [Lymnaea stagnalis]|uniref:UDP-glucuronosyltransferase n=1 Tax=Lymnaea stagnalis TaxID=6523 RepID=A0AAV2HG71_LYMST
MGKDQTLLLCLTLILTAQLGQGEKVVLFPAPAASYVIYHTNIAKALMDLGHHVWICIPDYLSERVIAKDIPVNVIRYGKKMGNFEDNLLKNTRMVEAYWEGEANSILSFIPLMKEVKKFTRGVLSDAEFIETLGDLKPDLMVFDGGALFKDVLVIAYKYDIPFAFIGTMHDMVLARVPFSPAAEPFPFGHDSNKMSFLSRVRNTLIALAMVSFDLFSEDILSTFAPEKPYLSPSELALRAEVFIAEIDHVLDYPRPTLPNTKLIGGSSASDPKPLKEDFKAFVDASTHGIAVVSFGSNEFPIPEAILLKLASAFQRLDLNTVWRANLTSPDPKKIMTSNWIPQNDLLGQPNTKVFVSHCGKNGQYEALYHAVPILCLPIFGDQFYNLERIRLKGFGLGADMREVSSEELADLIKEVTYQPKYKTNIQRASTLFKELYKVPMKEAAYWLDHVMKYGGEYMRSSGQEMPLYQFLLIDVMAFLFGVLLGVIIFMCLVIRFLCTCLSRSKKSKTKTA